jgi:hypothetical protein
MLDILCELGIPAFIALCVILLQTLRASRRLFGLVSTSPLDRSVTTCFISLCAYQILLANKQGMLWAAGPMFIHLLALIRIDHRTAALGMPPDLVPQAAEDEDGALQPAIGPG